MVDQGEIGYFKLLSYTPDGLRKDITYLSGHPTIVGEYSWTDPFGPERMSLTFPGVSIYERPGVGRLDWLHPNTAIDLIWEGHVPQLATQWRWEGRALSASWSTNPQQLEVDVQGALHEMDDFLAYPEYPSRPLPYEFAIERQFARHHDTRLQQLRTEWPGWWTNTYTGDAAARPWLVPEGVTPGENWTGLLTRATGSWQRVLTEYIQTLLSGMYTERGQWTLMLDPFRQPVLRHRDNAMVPNDDTAVIDVATPGVEITQFSEDWSQSLAVVYMGGRALSGTLWTGMAPFGDGRETKYVPLAYQRQAWPESEDNAWFKPHAVRREVYLSASDGLEQNQGELLAQEHLRRFASAGMTGTVMLRSDPFIGGQPFPRMLLQPGRSVQLSGWGGDPEGITAHISRVSINPNDRSAQLTVDTRFRDFLTVEQVMNRGRDSLQVVRTLATGKFQPAVPDMLFPWSYEESGIIPSGNGHFGKTVLDGMPEDTLFPWEEWTSTRPPSDPAYTSSYLKIGPKSSNASENWALASRNQGPGFSYQIRMSQAGSARLLQLAAYDRNGHVLKVGFHASFYLMSGTGVTTMPMLPAADAPNYPPYLAGQRYPFFPYAFEKYNPDGTLRNNNTGNTLATAKLLASFGSDAGKAGYWPGTDNGTDPPTGLLVQEDNVFSWDMSQQADFDPRKVDGGTGNNALLGSVFIMVYCDEQLSEDVYFLGRIYRAEPGVA
jgi:hypothetical protein